MGYRRIAKQFRVSAPSLYRHACEHVSRRLAKAREAREIADANALLAEVRTLYEAARDILSTPNDAGDQRTALSAIREACGTLEFLGRLLGELESGQTVNVNVLASPEWHHVPAVIFEAHADAPVLRQRVATALLVVGRANQDARCGLPGPR